MNEGSGAMPAPEFSRPFAVDNVARDGLAVEIEAKPAERAALARRFGLLGIDRLTARCRVRPVAGGMIELSCDFKAAVVQECVITLEPVPAQIEQSFAIRYTMGAGGRRPREEELIDMEAEDPPEALQGGAIDLGEAVAQQLAVALDPYPRSPGARLAAGDADQSAKPFAVLAKFKPKG